MEKSMRVVVLVSFIFFLLFADVSARKKQHFVLVHGATLGAWSWYKLVPLLESSGHRVTAIDLSASGINLLSYKDIHSFSNYSQPLIDFMASIPPHEKVILVGHSLGGASISQAMELYPQKVSVGVFLTASMPGPSLPFSVITEQGLSNLGTGLDNKIIYDDGPNNAPTAFMFGPKFISEVVYQYSPAEDATLAIIMGRPLRLVTGEDLNLTEANYGSVKRVYIIVEEDKVLPVEAQESMINANPPDQVLKIGGADHMVMSSKPLRVLAHLLAIARDYSGILYESEYIIQSSLSE